MQDIQLNTDQVNVTLRESLVDLFQDKVQGEMENLNCSYFTHNLIKNCYKPGHTVSSFYSDPEWQEEYWRDYSDSDLLFQKVCQAADAAGFAISSWDVIDPQSDVMKRRKAVCDLYDGVHFTFKHEDGTLENYSFGWKEDGRGKMGFDRLLKLADVVDDFRDVHFKLFSESIRHSSGETQQGQ